jgi:hypothetical protein|tara:strand:- start:846 stop:1100 length:255 start_codon:yes stop_codon:yes gene_type:complete
MVDIILQLKGQEVVANTTATTLSNASLVRVYAVANSVVTVANTSGTIGTFTIPGGFVEIVSKDPTDTIACAPNDSLLCTPLAYR